MAVHRQVGRSYSIRVQVYGLLRTISEARPVARELALISSTTFRRKWLIRIWRCSVACDRHARSTQDVEIDWPVAYQEFLKAKIAVLEQPARPAMTHEI